MGLSWLMSGSVILSTWNDESQKFVEKWTEISWKMADRPINHSWINQSINQSLQQSTIAANNRSINQSKTRCNKQLRHTLINQSIDQRWIKSYSYIQCRQALFRFSTARPRIRSPCRRRGRRFPTRTRVDDMAWWAAPRRQLQRFDRRCRSRRGGGLIETFLSRPSSATVVLVSHGVGHRMLSVGFFRGRPEKGVGLTLLRAFRDISRPLVSTSGDQGRSQGGRWWILVK